MQFCNCTSGVKDQLLKSTLVSSHGSGMNGGSSAHVLLRANGKNSTEMSVWGLWKHLWRSRGTRELFSSSVSCLPDAAHLLDYSCQPREERFSVYQTHWLRFIPLLCRIFSEAALISQLWTNEQNDSYCLLKKYLAFAWRQSFWILWCISVFPVLGFNAA